MDCKYLKLTHEDGVVTIAINNPPVNALSTEVFEELQKALRHFIDTPTTRVLILTGEGPVFAAGADIKEIQHIASSIDGEKLALRAQDISRLIEESPIPVICAVNGPCLGGGNEVALACHMRIASDRARIGQPEIRIGIIPGMGGTQRLPRLTGYAQALELLLTGDMIPAQQAKAIGLVNAVVPDAELRRAAVGLARRIAQNSKVVVAQILRAVREGRDMPLRDALNLEALLFGQSMLTEDKKEGVAAFVEKRPPKFVDK
jgi:enoyl-CoA hydratase/carnithine racemase